MLARDGLLRAATGRLKRVAELGEAVEHSLLRELRVDYEIKSMRVREADDETATVDLDAVIEATATGADGAVGRGTSRARGPVQPVREADGWNVVESPRPDRSGDRRCTARQGPPRAPPAPALRRLPLG